MQSEFAIWAFKNRVIFFGMITKAGFTWCIECRFIDDFFIFNSFDILYILLMR